MTTFARLVSTLAIGGLVARAVGCAAPSAEPEAEKAVVGTEVISPVGRWESSGRDDHWPTTLAVVKTAPARKIGGALIPIAS